MKKINKAFILILLFIPLLLNGQSQYTYQKSESFDEYLKKAPSFWNHMIKGVKELQQDSLSQETIKAKKMSLLEDLGKWQNDYLHIAHLRTEEQKNEYDSIVRYYFSSTNFWRFRQLPRYLEDGLDDSDLMQIYVQLSKYKPAQNADVFLDNFETFITKDFCLNLPDEVRPDVYHYYELQIFQSDLEKYEPSLNKKQKKRCQELSNLLETKSREWEQIYIEKRKDSIIVIPIEE